MGSCFNTRIWATSTLKSIKTPLYIVMLFVPRGNGNLQCRLTACSWRSRFKLTSTLFVNRIPHKPSNPGARTISTLNHYRPSSGFSYITQKATYESWAFLPWSAVRRSLAGPCIGSSLTARKRNIWWLQSTPYSSSQQFYV